MSHTSNADFASQPPRLVGESRCMRETRVLIEQVAETDTSVLILGESGSGKEVVAQNIHAKSARKNAPFVAINCGAIPQELLEAELFGHEKGAFTGAIKERKGRFEMAAGGTLFLDEIGDMPMHMQVKLLRVIQEKRFERVGGTSSIDTDVRIIAATHRNLEEQIDKGEVRLDLFYRLNVFPIELASLKERAEDIPLLIEEIVRKNLQTYPNPLVLGDSALRCLMNYEWPGNVRELANLLERLSIVGGGKEICAASLPERYRTGETQAAMQVYRGADEAQHLVELIPDEGIDLKAQLQKIEISLIREALEVSDWVVARSAKMLNLQRTTLVEKMRKYSIDRVSPVSEI
jgi:sigma-54 specific flagellar transcriptional regulator A